jgi:hypothetical protein
MKKIYLLAVLMGMLVIGQAQTFTVLPSNTVSTSVNPHGSVDSYIYFANAMQQNVTLIWEETNISHPSQWFLTVCDNFSCYTLPHAIDTMAACAIGDSAFLKVTCVPNEIPGNGTITYHVYDMNNPASSADVTFNFNVQGTAISPSDLDDRFAVAPSPAAETIQLTARGGLLDKGSVTLYDLRGQAVLQQDIHAVQSADLQVASLAPGIYVLRYDSNAGTMTKKVVVSH